jgi:hypothetical protein
MLSDSFADYENVTAVFQIDEPTQREHLQARTADGTIIYEDMQNCGTQIVRSVFFSAHCFPFFF